MWKFIIVVPLIMLLTGCKGDTESNNGRDYKVDCIDGVEYLIRRFGAVGYMSPRIDSETLNFIRCN